MNNDIKFNRGAGGLGRPLPSKDHIAALCLPCPTADLPGDFTASNRTMKFFSVQEAESQGIVDTSGVNEVKIAHYQISEFFRFNPQGELYVHFYLDGTAVGVTVPAVLNYVPANGEIRLVGYLGNIEPDGVGGDVANISALVNTLQASANGAEQTHKPVSILAAANDFTTDNFDLSTLPDLRALTAPNVSFVLAIDGDADSKGYELSTPALGAFLGNVAKASVHESISWVRKFNFTDGTNLETLAICKETIPVTPTLNPDALNDKGYLFLIKRVGIAGSYSYDSATSVSATSDYAFIENERTMDKAVRNIRTIMLPNLSAPIYLNEDGSIREDSIAFFQATSEGPLEAMKRDGEISAFGVTINPLQPILETSTLTIAVEIVPVGVARKIVFNIGFAVKISG
jgi:hypothetical protein